MPRRVRTSERFKVVRHQEARQVDPNLLLHPSEVARIEAAVRAKALEAIAVGNLTPGLELELISALDLGTVPWSQLPVHLKESLGLPRGDRGVDSLALNLSVAVQAKDYGEGRTVPLSRLATFHYLVRSDGSPLKGLVRQMIVATNESTRLPQDWGWSGAEHRSYSAQEIEAWRELARNESAKDRVAPEPERRELKRWPHQVECLKRCQKFLANESQRDFFVEMATGTGKSLIMADLLIELDPSQRAVIVVPKLDLMEQLANLFQDTLNCRVSRVGTGSPADLSAKVFVCVRNSAWQLQNLSFQLQILDEAHHYEPATNGSEELGVHAAQVLSLRSRKRIFFSATLRQNKPNFSFGLRPAINAGVIADYAVIVPELSQGDPRPGLVEILQKLPLARKILAFCNTVHEAKQFTHLLKRDGIAADHYNGHTPRAQREEVLKSFGRSRTAGGIRVLVTVDVVSEGVDLPAADTCLFVAPRHGVRLRQCVGRVLRWHAEKVDALVIAPPIVRDDADNLQEDVQLVRLVGELAQADPLFQSSLRQGGGGSRISSFSAAAFSTDDEPAELLRIRVIPSALAWNLEQTTWDVNYQSLLVYKEDNGDVLVPYRYKTANGSSLGKWVSEQRVAKSKGKLFKDHIRQLDSLGFVWDVQSRAWDLMFHQLQAYKDLHGKVLVPRDYKTADGSSLGFWVNTQRIAKAKTKLAEDRIKRLDSLGFVWDVFSYEWDVQFQRLQAYKDVHGDVRVPTRYISAVGSKLGFWVNKQRVANSKSKLSKDRIRRLESLGFVWDALSHEWDAQFQRLQAYKDVHGDVRVPYEYKTGDGSNLGFWVSTQRFANSKNQLSQDRIRRLDGLGFVWDVFSHEWDAQFQRLQAYKDVHRDVLVPSGYTSADGSNLGWWVWTQRSARVKGELSEDRIRRLDSLGFVWEVFSREWDVQFQRLLAYKDVHGDVRVPQNYKSEDCSSLGRWVNNQRVAKSKGELCEDRIRRLESLGFVWDARNRRLL